MSDLDLLTASLDAIADPAGAGGLIASGRASAPRITEGRAALILDVTGLTPAVRAALAAEIEARLKGLPGVTEVRIAMTSEKVARPLIAIASGKGGVGKSSVTVNLAAALAASGKTVGVLDADIWGFSIPRMLGMPDRLQAERIDGHDKPMIIPNERRVGTGLLKVVSTGMLVEDEGTALMWRGLMLTKAVEQFLNDVHWGELDYLLIDMPPGTGDVAMSSIVVVLKPSGLRIAISLSLR